MNDFEQSDRIAHLVAKELNSSLTAEEKAELDSWKEEYPQQWKRIALMLSKERLPRLLKRLDIADSYIRTKLLEANMPVVADFRSMQETPAPAVRRLYFLRRWGWAAASITLLLTASAYLWFAGERKSTMTGSHPVTSEADLAPGKTGAILTLADGRSVVLDSLGNGVVADQNGTQVLLDNGRLAYNPSKAAKVGYNTMTTPNGRQFQLVLPDGSRVWLNAASSIYYPTVFSGKERKVRITGEAYFEVVKDDTKPFHVMANDLTVKVLGTHFNVNAYEDESMICVTLLKGSVQVTATPGNGSVPEKTQSLKPGQQAQLGTTGEIKLRDDVNIEGVMAWKNGYFSFDKTDLATLMRQLARWYNVTIEYAGGIPERKFGGEISRNSNISEVLRILEISKVYCKVEKDKIIVLPK